MSELTANVRLWFIFWWVNGRRLKKDNLLLGRPLTCTAKTRRIPIVVGTEYPNVQQASTTGQYLIGNVSYMWISKNGKKLSNQLHSYNVVLGMVHAGQIRRKSLLDSSAKPQQIPHVTRRFCYRFASPLYTEEVKSTVKIWNRNWKAADFKIHPVWTYPKDRLTQQGKGLLPVDLSHISSTCSPETDLQGEFENQKHVNFCCRF